MKILGDTDRERVAKLRAEGLGYIEIERLTGVKESTARRWCDPDYAERARRSSREAKQKRKHICPDCGAEIRFDSVRCNPCSRLHSRKLPHEEIVRLRIAKGLSQSDIAKQLGCSQGHVSMILKQNGYGVGRGSGPGRGAKLS